MVYAPGTLETDPKKQNMALQQHAKTIDENSDNIATLQGQTSGYESAWTSYTPTVSAIAGTFTSVTGAGWYKQIGKTILIRIRVSITTNGTANNGVICSLPVTSHSSASQTLAGRENAVAGYGLISVINSSSTTLIILKYDGTYPGSDGAVLDVGGVYEAA